MSKRQPLSIRQTLWLAIALAVASTLLGSTAVHSYRTYRLAQRARALAAQTMAETYAAQVGPLLLTGNRQALSDLIAQWTCPANVRLLAVAPLHGDLWATRGAVELLAAQAQAIQRAREAAASTAWHIPARKGDPLSDLQIAVAPIRPAGASEPIGHLICAAAGSSPSFMSATEAWQLSAWLMAVAATGMVLGFAWLKASVLDPLASLSSHSKNNRPNGSHPTGKRDDEIGQLARVLDGLQMDIEQWRTRASRLEHSISDRVALETERITRELKNAQKAVWTDPLTHLGNRRLLDDKFAEIFAAQRDSKRDLAIVMMDLDNFKLLNDTLGHKAGDELLRFTGELLQQCLREQDLAIRYGGDEFVLVLPSVSAEQARTITDRTITLFAQQARLVPISTKPTMSAGIASLRQHTPTSAESLLQMADAALYQAKSSGKACTQIYLPPSKSVALARR